MIVLINVWILTNMDRKLLCFFAVQALTSQVITANMSLHPTIKQLLLSSLGSTPAPVSIRQPSVTVSKQTSSPVNLQSLAAMASLLSSAQVPLTPPKPPVSNTLLTSYPETSFNGVDANLLNNLAMAMQLLIVSNLLSSPSQESTPEPLVVSGYYESTEPLQPISVSYMPQTQYPVPASSAPQKPSQNPNYYHYEQPNPSQPNYTPQASLSMPNSNFVGSSTFANSNPFSGSIPAPSGGSSSRSGFTLMSPYEALSPSSPFSDPILSSPYGSIMSSKRDFQSPYASIMASENKDLFSFSDFF